MAGIVPVTPRYQFNDSAPRVYALDYHDNGQRPGPVAWHREVFADEEPTYFVDTLVGRYHVLTVAAIKERFL